MALSGKFLLAKDPQTRSTSLWHGGNSGVGRGRGDMGWTDACMAVAVTTLTFHKQYLLILQTPMTSYPQPSIDTENGDISTNADIGTA